MSTKVGSVTGDKISPTTNNSSLSLWTIGAVAVVAYSLANVLHEGLGHGGACVLMGGRPTTLNAIFFTYDHRTVSSEANRFIAAAGGLVNLTSGFFALAVLRWTNPRSTLRYFFWLFSAVSLLMAFGYLLFSGVMGVGDWIPVTQGFGPPMLTRLALIAVGGLLYFFVAPKLLMPELRNFLDSRASLKIQIKRLVRFPYFVGGITFLIAAVFNPDGVKILLISALAASFGGTSLLVWHPVLEEKSLLEGEGQENLSVANPRKGWLVAAAIALAIFVGVLGPGWRF